MKVLVTGGAGFIGSHLVDAYLERGDQVAIIDDLSSGSYQNIESAVKAGAEFYEVSLLSSKTSEIFEKFKPDLINHHAAQKSVRDSVSDPQKDAEINILGLLNLLEAAKKSHCRKLIFASSGGVVYGDQVEFPATENHTKRPMSPYGVSKMASELYLDFYSMQWGFDVTSLRYANIYGPRQDPEGEAGVVAIFSKRMIANEKTIIFGTGYQTRDFVFVGDAVAANLAADKILKGCQAYNIGTARETSVKRLHQILASSAKYTKSVDFEAAKAGEQARSVLSYDLFKSKTGWQPKVAIEDGLRRTFQWFSDSN